MRGSEIPKPWAWYEPMTLTFSSVRMGGGALFSCTARFHRPLQAEPAAKVLVIDGRIDTSEAAPYRAEPLAGRDGKILPVGTTRDLSAHPGKAARVIDLSGEVHPSPGHASAPISEKYWRKQNTRGET